jgi:2-haloacid dehalogenase
MTVQPIYIFDAYGTLFDVNSAVYRHADAIGAQAKPFAETWRAKQLEYTWVLSLANRYEPFWTLTERALDFAFAKFPGIDRDLRARLLDAYRTLSAYAEVRDVLVALRERGARMGILSNGDADMLRSAILASQLEGLFDAVLSVEKVRVFKTHPRTYALVTEQFQASATEITFVSSNRWDVFGAAAHGFSAVWVNRAGNPDEYAELPPKAVIADLSGLFYFAINS